MLRHRLARFVTSLATIAILGPASAFAIGPVDGEVGVFYQLAESEVSSFGALAPNGLTVDDDAPGAGVRGELWFFEDFGVSASGFDLGGDGALDGFDVRTLDLDVRYKVLAPTRNSFLAFGVGWQEIELGDVETSGPRLVAEGRLGFAGLLYAYGRGAYLLELDDISEGVVRAEDGEGHEYELGLAVEPFPFFSIWAGYKHQSLSFSTDGSDLDVDTGGAFVGVGVHF